MSTRRMLSLVTLITLGFTSFAVASYAEVEFRLPYPPDANGGNGWRVSQGNNGDTNGDKLPDLDGNHVDPKSSYYAFDFGMPEFSEVAASAAGVVVALESGFGNPPPVSCPEKKKFRNEANYVVLEHSDGTRTLYLHLCPGCVHVRRGEYVQRGQIIGESGQTGGACGPHLHFQRQVNTGKPWYLQSLKEQEKAQKWYTQSQAITFADVLSDGGIPVASPANSPSTIYFPSTNSPLPSGTIVTLASDLSSSPFHLILDSMNTYWTEWGGCTPNCGAVRRVARDGGAVMTLADGLSYPVDLAVDDSHVYWTTSSIVGCAFCQGVVQRVAKTGGKISTLASGLNSPYGIAVDSKYVYWTEIDSFSLPTGTLRRIKKTVSNGTPQILVSGLSTPQHLALAGERVYWVEAGPCFNGCLLGAGALKSSLKTGEDVRSLAVGLSWPHALVIDNEEVYLTESVPFVGSGSPQGSVKRFPLPDGPIQSLVTGLSGPNEVATDKLDVYWTQFDPYPSGPLKTIPKSGGSIATVVSFPFGLEDLTVGDEAVYFLGGSVLKVIKPNPVSGGGGWSEEPPE